ncbi:MAG: hypothetical protein ACREAR_04410 [Nitrosotalea sp.]
MRKVALPFFALALISTTNLYIQIYDLFDESEVSASAIYVVKESFAKILNSINMLIIGYTISQLVPIIIRKYDSDRKEKEDFENWKAKHGFSDDPLVDVMFVVESDMVSVKIHQISFTNFSNGCLQQKSLPNSPRSFKNVLILKKVADIWKTIE